MSNIAHVSLQHHPIYCIIGILPHERKNKQTIYVDIGIDIDIARAAGTGDLSHACDYTALGRICSSLAISNQYLLLETLAIDTLKAIKEEFPKAQAARICIHKPLEEGTIAQVTLNTNF